MRALLVALPLLLAGCLSFHTGPMPGEPKTARFVSVGGARVRFTDVGQGPPVVLIHGFASALETWETVVPELSKNHRVIALDLKGFGWTDRPAGDYSPAAQAQIVLELMTKRGVDRAAIVAHSWGSSVALALTLAAPERVSRIALYDAWVYEEQLPSFFLMSRASGVGEFLFGTYYTERADERIALAFYDKKYLTEKLAEEIEAAVDRPGTTAAALAAVRGQRYEEIQKRYPKIDKPVLLLWGREDIVTTLQMGERLSRELPHARLVVYPRCGHFPMIEARTASTAELVGFLDDTRVVDVKAPESKAAENKAPDAKAPDNKAPDAKSEPARGTKP